MPSFMFEKLSPPVRRGPIAPEEPEEKRPRGLIVELLDRFAEARARRSLRRERPDGADQQKSSE